MRLQRGIAASIPDRRGLPASRTQGTPGIKG